MYIHNIPAVFYNNNKLINHIDNLIDIGYEKISLLSSNQKNQVVTLIMDALEEDQGYALFDTDEFTRNCDHFKNYLKTGSLTDLFKFTVSLEDSAFKKYQDYLENIFEYLNDMRRAA